MIHIGFIGLGLIGGSIARAFRKNRNDIKITAFDPDPATRALALSEEIADDAVSRISAAFSDCDYIFLCGPVACNDDNLAEVLRYKKPSCILTDVGSVKTPIFEKMKELQLENCFIGGHPMAGSERIGFANSKASLLENAYYILTPAPAVCPDAIEAFYELISSTGAIVMVMDSQKHDYITAAVSHLPHVIASGLVNLVRDHDDTDQLMRTIAAGGFRDITRIASASPVMWQQICLTNTEHISSLLSDYISSLCRIKEQLDSRDPEALYAFFDSARTYRDSFNSAVSGPIIKSPVLSVDIPDETGAIAAVSTLLALAGINIKNIRITHNREAEEGVLRIEFYDDASVKKAAGVLITRGYTIHTND